MQRVVIVGGGVAGLATAVALRDLAKAEHRELELTLLEAAPHLGGNIHTEHADGYHVEWGPNGFLDNAPATLELVRRLGLEPKLLPADATAAQRYLFRRGKLHLLPSGPLAFLTSSLLSLGGRLRVLREPWTKPPPAGVDESVLDFAARHLGDEAAQVLVDAMVSGVFAGNAQKLSLASAFPKMAAMERAHGSLVKAMLARRKELRAAGAGPRSGGPAGPGGTLTSFAHGLDTLVAALRAELAQVVQTSQRVEGLERDAASGWRLCLAGGATLTANQVLLAVPSSCAAGLVSPFDAALASALLEIPSAPVVVVALAFDAKTIGGAPRGFGFLAPRNEGLRILGCLWDSSVFPDRAPQGKVLLRAMVGGAHDPSAIDLDDEALLKTVQTDLATAMHLEAPPERAWIFRHRLGIAQYTPGHSERLERIQQGLRRNTGLFVAGQSYFGVSMNACIERAALLARELMGT